jgi:hypothetical protein
MYAGLCEDNVLFYSEFNKNLKLLTNFYFKSKVLDLIKFLFDGRKSFPCGGRKNVNTAGEIDVTKVVVVFPDVV